MVEIDTFQQLKAKFELTKIMLGFCAFLAFKNYRMTPHHNHVSLQQWGFGTAGIWEHGSMAYANKKNNYPETQIS